MKLIIDMPEEVKRKIDTFKGKFLCGDGYDFIQAIKNGTPLDDVKTIIEKQIERDFAFAETETLKVPCHYGTANGLQVAVRILDNIGKAEGEDT